METPTIEVVLDSGEIVVTDWPLPYTLLISEMYAKQGTFSLVRAIWQDKTTEYVFDSHGNRHVYQR